MTEVAQSALPTAGSGLFAVRAFSCGNVVLDESPLFYTKGAGQYASAIWRLTAQVLDAGASETIEVRVRVSESGACAGGARGCRRGRSPYGADA
jgi:hypothetical protein